MIKKSLRNNQPLRFLLRFAALIAVMMISVMTKAQTSGLYYIANNNKNAYVLNSNTNWYLVPASDGGETGIDVNRWAWQSNTATPLVTTYQTRKDVNSVWAVVKSGDYYYLIHLLSGQYMTHNESDGGANNRRRFHMETNNSPGDQSLFSIIAHSPNAYYSIQPKTVTAGHRYLNPSKNNQPKYYGYNTQENGAWIGGLIGLYSSDASADEGSKWFLEGGAILSAPTISDVSASNTITIDDANSLPVGYTIRYTTGDGSQAAPTATTGTEYSGPITVTNNWTVKAVVVRYGLVLTNVASKTVEPAVVAPTVTNNSDGTVSLSTPTPNAEMYYTLDGTDPSINGTFYTTAFSLGNATVVKAVTKFGSVYSDVTTYNVPQYDAPTISFNSGTSQVTITSSGTAYYTTDGSTPSTASSEYSAPFTVSSATTVKAIATHAGYLTSEVATLSITQVATPTIQNNGNNAISITSATPGATFYYTTDGTIPTTSSNLYTAPLTENVSGVTIKAIAVKENMIDSEVGSGSVTLKCSAPVISRIDNQHFTITCDLPSSGVTIYYTTDGSTTPTTSSSHISSGETVTWSLPVTVKAMATASNYNNSDVVTKTLSTGLGGNGTEGNPYTIESQSDVEDFINKANDENSAYFKVISEEPLDFSAVDHITVPFSGNFDGGLQTLTGLTHPLFDTVRGGTVKNVNLKSIAVTGSGSIGAICGTADGAARIYNCGILPSNSNFTSTSTVKSTDGYCGGLVGLLNGTARVINCFSYANIIGGTTAAGIVGYNNTSGANQNNYATKTIVMNCVFYGEITGATIAYPVYGGNVIDNNGTTSINNYNYYRDEAAFDDNYANVDAYNRTWPAKEKNLRRFEYYRSILNSNRRLCAFWITDHNVAAQTAADTALVAKWVLDPSIAPFPVLKKWGKYPSIINIDSLKVWDTVHNQWVQRTNALPYQGKKLGELLVTIQTGAHPGTVGQTVINNASRTLVVTDMDTASYDYCYGKVQLPYYNEIFGNPSVSLDPHHPENYTTRYHGNYTNKVVTGWKITYVATDGTISDYNSFVANCESGYNYADRHCIEKDLFDTDGRVFAQGGYYYVPEGVTGITIEAYWGDAFYLQAKDNYLDRVDVAATKNYGSAFTPAGQLYDTIGYFDGSTNQTIDIYNDFATIKTAFMANHNCNVYDQAVVLLSNYPLHAEDDFAKVGDKDYTGFKNNGEGGVTLMSADFDMDNEPDFCFPFQWRAATTYTRIPLMPFRFDFLPVPELGMAMRHNTYAYSIGIFVPQGHFEITETSFMYTTQFEYMSKYEGISHQQPLILNGGQFEQIVCHADAAANIDHTRNII